MSTTGRDLVAAGMRLIGALASGDTPQASEATDGLSALNRMLDTFSNERLMIYTVTEEVFPLTAGQAAYTMGTGGNFNTTRPQLIQRAVLRMVSASGNTDLPMRILTVNEYAQLILKGTQSSIPTDLYPAGTYPLETLTVWPVPSATASLVLYSVKPLTQIALDTPISLPPGCEELLIYNWAVRQAPEYGKAPREDIVAVANEAKANFKRLNYRPRYLQVDSALQSASGTWNWLTGEPT